MAVLLKSNIFMSKLINFRVMFDKKFLIIILAAIIIMAFVTFSFTKADVSLEVAAEHIPNTSEIYLVCKIIDNDGNVIDTPYGKMTIEILDENGSGAVYEDVPIEHGILVMRHDGEPETVNIHYDGSLIYKPCDYRANPSIENTTGLTDDNLTSWY